MLIHLTRSIHNRFWERANRLATPGSPCFEHFIAATEQYVNGVAQEIEDRMHNRVRPLEEFIRLRRDTAAARSVLGLCEFGLNLPNEVIQHPIISALTLDAVDLTFISNVSCFYRVNRTRILSKKTTSRRTCTHTTANPPLD